MSFLGAFESAGSRPIVRPLTFSEWVGLALSTAGIVLSIISPWPAVYVQKQLGSSELAARAVTCVPVVVCVGLLGVVPPTVRRLRSKRQKTEPKTFRLRGPVSERKLHDTLLRQLIALVEWLKLIAHDLMDEDEASRENLHRHREAILVQLDEEESLLDPRDPAIRQAAKSPRILQHLSWRGYAQRRLRRIHRILRPRMWRKLDTTFGIASRKAAALRRSAEKEYERLKSIDRRTLSRK